MDQSSLCHAYSDYLFWKVVYSLEAPNSEPDFMILPRWTQDRDEQIPCREALEKQ